MVKYPLLSITLICVVFQVILAANILREKRQESSPVNPGMFLSLFGQSDLLKDLTQKLSGDNKQVSNKKLY